MPYFLGEEMDKPNCYECVYRGTIPGDCHSTCNHPDSGYKSSDPLWSLVTMIARRVEFPTTPLGSNMGIVGNPHGIRNGWFFWPANFDPVWLESCDGFKQRGI